MHAGRHGCPAVAQCLLTAAAAEAQAEKGRRVQGYPPAYLQQLLVQQQQQQQQQQQLL